ncbi:MAG: hypothetical protein Q8S13_04615, partial [Dehalococcoidia bacterium]|nr:hypothetical protein [Dehalococcoidia bacterium]
PGAALRERVAKLIHDEWIGPEAHEDGFNADDLNMCVARDAADAVLAMALEAAARVAEHHEDGDDLVNAHPCSGGSEIAAEIRKLIP